MPTSRDLQLPAVDHVRLWSRWVWVGIVGVGTILVSVVFLVTGRWAAVRRWFLALRVRQTDVRLDTLTTIERANQAILTRETSRWADLVAKRKQLQKDRLATQLEIDGKSSTEIISELRARGY